MDEEGNVGLYPSEDLTSNRSDIGVSAPPMLACVLLVSCMLLALACLSFRKLECRMPVAVSCSFALAAVTHRPEKDDDAAVLSVMWEEVPRMASEALGHCCFTSQRMIDVDPARKYAGSKDSSNGRQT